MDLEVEVPEVSRKEIAEALGRLEADTFTLYLRTHFYHWNVSGPRFRELHLAFEEQYRDLWEAVDEIAERIRALDFLAPGTMAEFIRITSVQEEEAVPDAGKMIENLVEGHETVLRTAREVLDLAEPAGDVSTVDLVTSRMQWHEKTAWMLSASV
ncbi:MAG TPA: Dps family protein [Actinomycetota bacterium]|nr:Dps family protein [Actinomycetota bacterium]